MQRGKIRFVSEGRQSGSITMCTAVGRLSNDTELDKLVWR